VVCDLEAVLRSFMAQRPDLMTQPLCVSMETVLRSLQALRPPDLYIKLINKVMVRVVPDLETVLRSSMAQRPDFLTKPLCVSMETELLSLQAQRPPDLIITVINLGAERSAPTSCVSR
jgi:hypothetical protein